MGLGNGDKKIIESILSDTQLAAEFSDNDFNTEFFNIFSVHPFVNRKLRRKIEKIKGTGFIELYAEIINAKKLQIINQQDFYTQLSQDLLAIFKDKIAWQLDGNTWRCKRYLPHSKDYILYRVTNGLSVKTDKVEVLSAKCDANDKQISIVHGYAIDSVNEIFTDKKTANVGAVESIYQSWLEGEF